MSVKSGITHLFELQPGEVVLSLVGPILPECWFQISDRIVHGLNDNNGNTHYFVQLPPWGGGREPGDNVCSRIYIGIFLLTDWHQWSDSVIIKTIILSPIDHSQSFHHQTGINSNCYFYHHHHHHHRHVSSWMPDWFTTSPRRGWRNCLLTLPGALLCMDWTRLSGCYNILTRLPARDALPATLLVN